MMNSGAGIAPGEPYSPAEAAGSRVSLNVGAVKHESGRNTMTRRHILLVALLALLRFPSQAPADLIGVISNSWEGGSAFTSTSNDPLYFAFGNFTLVPGWSDRFQITNSVYDSYAFTHLDVGSVFYLTVAEDTHFTQLAANLVNGQPDRIGYIMDDDPIPVGADYHYTQQYEDYMLAGSLFLTNGIDLQGTVIDGFSLRINDLVLDSPGSDLNGDGNWTDLRFSVTLSIEGHVIPEPSTFFMLCTGATIFAVCSLKRKRKAPTIADTLRICRSGKSAGAA